MTPASLLITKSGKRLVGDSGHNSTHKAKVPLSLEELIVNNGQLIRDDDRKIAYRRLQPRSNIVLFESAAELCTENHYTEHKPEKNVSCEM